MIEIDEKTKELLNSMGFIPSEKDERDYKIEIDKGEAHIDFRKENGRRWARVGGVFIKDPDTIPILKAFKEAREKLQSSSGDTGENGEAAPVTLGRETISKPIPIHTRGDQSPPAPTFDYIKDIVGNDVLEIFGDTGTGKSKFVHALALEALAAGKSVFFLDTERNLSKQDVEQLGASYKYTPLFPEIKNIVLGNPKKVDLFIIDSVGLPILTRFAMLSMKEKGNALLDLIAVVGKLKEWAYENDALAVITNQPESEFNKTDEEKMHRKPFGDKACFAAKEIWLTKKLKSGLTGGTKCSIESFRSRSMKNGLSIMQIEVTDQGTKIMREVK